MPFDVQGDFLLWGSLYVLAKWTIGIWAFRRARAYFTQRRAAQRVV